MASAKGDGNREMIKVEDDEPDEWSVVTLPATSPNSADLTLP